MRAIILSAGQGRRLYPLTKDVPKCLLSLRDGMSALELQLRILAAGGIEEATVVVGFGAGEVERLLRDRAPCGLRTETLFNPFFESTDNLITAWLARERMRDDFLLLNGDTIFETDLLRRLLDSPRAPATMAIDRKPTYDDDDMKVSLSRQGRVRAVSKTLDPTAVDAEAIGAIRFQGSGARTFTDGLERAVRDTAAHGRYYLSVLDSHAQRGRRIETVSVEGLWWQEIDCPQDLAEARAALQAAPLLAEVWEDPAPPLRSRAADAR